MVAREELLEWQCGTRERLVLSKLERRKDEAQILGSLKGFMWHVPLHQIAQEEASLVWDVASLCHIHTRVATALRSCTREGLLHKRRKCSTSGGNPP